MSDPTALPRFANGPSGPPASSLGDPPPVDGAPSAELTARRDRIIAVLRGEGFRPEVDQDGDVVVRVEGQALFVRCFDTQPPMIRVFGQWQLDEQAPGDFVTRLRAANAMTGALNLIKVTALEDWLVIAVDLVVTETTPLETLLTATLEAVRGSVQTWYTAVMQLDAEQ